MYTGFRFKALIIIFVVVVLLLSAFVLIPIGPSPEGAAAMSSSERVRVVNDGMIYFHPQQMMNDTGIIFFPGARTAPASYAPYGRRFAELGSLLVIVPGPINYAPLGFDAARPIIEKNPGIKKWFVAGHSAGGGAAARFAQKYPALISGLIMISIWPPVDLSTSSVPALILHGTRDMVDDERLSRYRKNYPPRLKIVSIKGANHAQFGWYGPHIILPDPEPEIGHQEQFEITINEMLAFMSATGG